MTYALRDPIHRTITFTDAERRVIDHPFVQRLRYVRQLGINYLVYPGATHDRFSHVVGAMHVVGRLWTQILSSSGDVLRKYFSDDDLAYFGRILRLAALLHDAGHPPFSHAAEAFMPPLADLDIPRLWWVDTTHFARQATHEDYSVMIIAALGRERDLLRDSDEAQDIASLVHHGIAPSHTWQTRFSHKANIHQFLSNLISGEIDCDRMDYLLRDAYYTGVNYGAYDIEHLLENVGVTETDHGLVLMIDANAVRAFEDFLLARYHMFLQVYWHKTTLGFGYILERSLADHEWEFHLPTNAKEFCACNDSILFEKLFVAAEDAKNKWSVRLTRRLPLKLVFSSANTNPKDVARLGAIRESLDTAHIEYFIVDVKQYLFRTAFPLLVRTKFLEKIEFVPIEQYSLLLQKYNEVIDQTHMYVEPEWYAEISKNWH